MVQNYVAELNIGIKRDPQFGLVLIISMGGELVNFLNDSEVVLLPATKKDIKNALYSLKGVQLLQGYRGRPLGDIEAVLNVAQSITFLAEIIEIND